MIAINDTGAFAGLSFVESQLLTVTPNAFEIQALIGATTFVNSQITTAFKNLLIDISNTCLNPNPLTFPSISVNVKNQASLMFTSTGFHKNSSGVIAFTMATNALDIGTTMIIDRLHDITNFNDKAANAFVTDYSAMDWSRRANNIRAITGSGLKKLHFITVTKLDINSTIQDINNTNTTTVLLNNVAVNNRFAVISAVPAMPRIKIRNNSNVSLKVRLKIKFKKTSDASGTGTIYRIFLDHFPDQNSADHTDTIGTTQIYTKVIASQSSWEIDYEGKIRGGDATIEYIENPLVWNDSDIYKFTFNIRARNPVRQDVLDYLNAPRTSGSYLSRYWFILKLIRHESMTNDANEFRQFNPATLSQYLKNNNILGLPNFGEPRGYGLGQIDNYGIGELPAGDVAGLGLTQALADIQQGGINEYQTMTDNQGRVFDRLKRQVAPDDAVWNWKNNIDMIVHVVEEQEDYIDGHISNMRDSIINWNAAHPSNNWVVVPPPENYIRVQYKWVNTNIQQLMPFNNLFQQGTSPTLDSGTRSIKSFYDAMLIKEYNGHSGGGDFMEMNIVSGKPTLIFNYLNNRGFNYVERISNTND